jgi:hypothetical protein
MALSAAAKRRQAYWDSLLKDEKPKALHWNRSQKASQQQPPPPPPPPQQQQPRHEQATALQAAVRGTWGC